MITAIFKLDNKGEPIGFQVAGHAGYADCGADIVCAGVSSAVMLTVNTITDYICADAEVNVSPNNDGFAQLLLKKPYNELGSLMLKSLFDHLRVLEEQYGHIKVHTER